MKFSKVALSLNVLAWFALFFAAGCKKSNETDEIKLARIQSRTQFVLDSVIKSIPKSISSNQSTEILTYKDGSSIVRRLSQLVGTNSPKMELRSLQGTVTPLTTQPIIRNFSEYRNLALDGGAYQVSLFAEWRAADGWVVAVDHMSINGSPGSNTEILPDGTEVSVFRWLGPPDYKVTLPYVPSVTKKLTWKAGLSYRVTVKAPGGQPVSGPVEGQFLEYERTLNAVGWIVNP